MYSCNLKRTVEQSFQWKLPFFSELGSSGKSAKPFGSAQLHGYNGKFGSSSDYGSFIENESFHEKQNSKLFGSSDQSGPYGNFGSLIGDGKSTIKLGSETGSLSEQEFLRDFGSSEDKEKARHRESTFSLQNLPDFQLTSNFTHNVQDLFTVLHISPIFYGDISQKRHNVHKLPSEKKQENTGHIQGDQSNYDDNEDRAVHERRVREADEVESRIFGGSHHHEQFAHFHHRLYRDIRLDQFQL